MANPLDDIRLTWRNLLFNHKRATAAEVFAAFSMATNGGREHFLLTLQHKTKEAAANRDANGYLRHKAGPLLRAALKRTLKANPALMPLTVPEEVFEAIAKLATDPKAAAWLATQESIVKDFSSFKNNDTVLLRTLNLMSQQDVSPNYARTNPVRLQLKLDQEHFDWSDADIQALIDVLPLVKSTPWRLTQVARVAMGNGGTTKTLGVRLETALAARHLIDNTSGDRSTAFAPTQPLTDLPRVTEAPRGLPPME